MRIVEILAPYAYLVAIIPLWAACVCLSIGSLFIVRRLRELKVAIANLQAANERQFHGELLRKRSTNGAEPSSSEDGEGYVSSNPKKRPFSVV
jgi:hypothetical protein